MTHNQAALAQQIRLLYDMKQQSFIKTVLNNEDPSTLQRHLQYIHTLNRQQQNQIQKSQAIITQLTKYQKQAKMTRQQLTLLIKKETATTQTIGIVTSNTKKEC